MDFQKMFLGIKPKKALKTLKKTLLPLNLAQADRSYRKRNIDYKATFDDYNSTYEITHLFATKYHNTFSATAYFSRDRRILKEKNGKVTKYGRWEYWIKASVLFHALPLKEYTQTQAKLKEIYPQFKIYFYKDIVEISMDRHIKNLKEAEKLIKDFAYQYKKVSTQLLKNLNYIHDEIHK